MSKKNLVSVRLSDESVERVEEVRQALSETMPFYDWTFTDAVRCMLDKFDVSTVYKLYGQK